MIKLAHLGILYSFFQNFVIDCTKWLYILPINKVLKKVKKYSTADNDNITNKNREYSAPVTGPMIKVTRCLRSDEWVYTKSFVIKCIGKMYK